MVFSIENETQKMVATIQNGDITEQYKCLLQVCENPICTCNYVRLSFSPYGQKNEKSLISPYKVSIDFRQQILDYPADEYRTGENREFAELLIGGMNDDDFEFLWGEYYELKNQISEEASDDSIEARFDYREIEENGLLAAYNDVLPYDLSLWISINGKNLLVFDQYCVLPDCTCSDAHLSIMLPGEYEDPGEELYFITVDYRKKKWGKLKGGADSVDVKIVRSVVKEIPDLYNLLSHRHMRLKSIYFQCRQRDYTPVPQAPETGRNDLCPCGSGKKYKKCCSRN